MNLFWFFNCWLSYCVGVRRCIHTSMLYLIGSTNVMWQLLVYIATYTLWNLHTQIPVSLLTIFNSFHYYCLILLPWNTECHRHFIPRHNVPTKVCVDHSLPQLLELWSKYASCKFCYDVPLITWYVQICIVSI